MTELAKGFDRLERMSPADLRAEWRRVLKCPPPAITPDLLRRGIGYRLQELVHGGLTSAARRELDQITKRVARGDAPLSSSSRPKPGTRLLRTWHDRTHIVLVSNNGFIFENRLYASLTPIAREITGTAWSGPRFFGLLAKKARVPIDAETVGG